MDPSLHPLISYPHFNIQIDHLSLQCPNEIALHICSFLPVEDIAKCAQLNRTWRRVARDTFLWRSLFYASFPDSTNMAQRRKDWFYQYSRLYPLNQDLLKLGKCTFFSSHPSCATIVGLRKGLLITSSMEDYSIKTNRIANGQINYLRRIEYKALAFSNRILALADDYQVMTYQIHPFHLKHLSTYSLGKMFRVEVVRLLKKHLWIIGHQAESQKGIISIINLKTRQKIQAFFQQNEEPFDIQMNSNWLALAFVNKTIKVWPMRQIESTTDFTKGYKTQVIDALCFQIWQDQLFAGLENGQVYAWNLKTHQYQLFYQSLSHQPIYQMRILNYKMYLGLEDQVEVVDMLAKICINSCQTGNRHVYSLYVIPGKVFAGFVDGRVMVWDFQSRVA